MINTETSEQFFAYTHHLEMSDVWRYMCRLFVIIGLSLLLVLGSGFWAPLSQADIRQYHNGDGQMLDQSRRSMRDLDRRPWQVVVFQERWGDEIGHTELRLVGFPGQITFQHPEPLVIRTRTGQDFLAADEFGEQPPAPSVGQFDVTAILPQLPLEELLILELPTSPQTTLKIPAALVEEWRLVS